jgi:hypothetical protein
MFDASRTGAAGAPWIEALTDDGLGSRRVGMHPDGDAWQISLSAPSGAQHLQIPVGRADALLCRCELPVAADGRARLELRVGAAGELAFPDDPGLRVLPADATAPPPLLPPNGERWQVALLVDTTTRLPAAERKPGPLLADAAHWEPLRSEMLGLLTALATEPARGEIRLPDLEYAVLGFADIALPGVEAPDLKPRPDAVLSGQRQFQRWHEATAASALSALQASSGADWMDALAEALHAAAGLPWRLDARKLLLLFGDSPGHAVLWRFDAAASGRVREMDVDLAAQQLHRAGIEIVTLFHAPTATALAALDPRARGLVQNAAAQYRRLATTPEHALKSDDLVPLELAAWLRERTHPLARCVSLGWVAA